MRHSLLAALTIAALGCTGDEIPDEPGSVGSGDSVSGTIALPPSADVPRASIPGHAPDSLRPEPEVEADTTRRLDAREFDLRTIVDAYRDHYQAAYNEEGSSVRGRVDPELAADARRRVALDWGYVELGAWDAMRADMTSDQRIVLEREIVRADSDLAARLHGDPDAGPAASPDTAAPPSR